MDGAMPLTPKPKSKTEPVGFRCPVDLLEWLKQLESSGISRTDAIVWAMENGRDLVGALGDDLSQRLEGYARLLGMDRAALLRRLLELGFSGLERDMRTVTSKKPNGTL